MSGFLHQTDKRFTVVCQILRHRTSDTLIAVFVQDPTQFRQDGAMVIQKCPELLAARGAKPPCDQVEVLSNEGPHVSGVESPIGKE